MYIVESSPAPGVYLRDDPICGTQLENQSELRAPSAERAAYYLDAAVAARTVPDATDDDDARNSHMLFTLHVYQYRVDSPSQSPGNITQSTVCHTYTYYMPYPVMFHAICTSSYIFCADLALNP